jgi:ribosomal-protein-alanine N-acetyltransferase
MIRTPRLLLRHARMSDLADFHDILRRPEAMAYWSTPPHPDLATTEVWLASTVARDPAVSVEFAVEYQGRVIGKAGGGEMPEVGYIFHPDYWGQGFAYEAMRAVVDHAFAHRPVDHLLADIDPRNDASRRLLVKLGFHYSHHADNTFCISGEWVHSDFYILPRPVPGA